MIRLSSPRDESRCSRGTTLIGLTQQALLFRL